jgi:hypothetical protein
MLPTRSLPARVLEGGVKAGVGWQAMVHHLGSVGMRGVTVNLIHARIPTIVLCNAAGLR